MKKTNKSLEEAVVGLRQENEQLRATLTRLEKENEVFSQRVGQLEQSLKKITTDLTSVKTNVASLTLREVMRSLENYCVLEVLGSKTQMKNRKIYSFGQLKNCTDTDVQAQFKGWNKLTENDINTLTYFKEVGDAFAHKCSVTKKEDLFLPKAEDDEDQQTKIKLLTLLEGYCNNAKKPFGVGPL